MPIETKTPRLRVLASDILPFMQEQSRQPFMEVMALCLAARPTPKRLTEFAADYPDRWANMCAIFARLAGYSDKVEVKGTFIHAIADLSDAELREHLAKIQAAPEHAEVLAQLAAESDRARGTLLIEDHSDDPKTIITKSKPKKKIKSSKLDKPLRLLRIKRRD